jgi:enoyl-CoA hydratase/carnithine racemase
MTTQLRTERLGATLLFILDGSGRHNALSGAIYAAGVEALNVAESNPELRSVVITGAGGHFSSGDEDPEPLPEHMAALGRWIEALQAFPKPVVAAVEGMAEGAACALALACDLVVAARDARFAPAHAGTGMAVLGDFSYLLARTLSRQQALEWLWLAPPRDARSLQSLGLVNQVVEPGQAQSAALALCERLNALPLHALSTRKELMNRAVPWALERGQFLPAGGEAPR